MQYRLIVSDFDGTLRRSDGSIGRKTTDAIRRYRAAGGVFALCSGRMTASVLPIARSLGLSGPAVSFQGGTISDIETGAVLYAHPFSVEDAYLVASTLEEFGYHVHIYTAERFFSNRDDAYLRIYEEIVGVKGTVLPAVAPPIRAERLEILKIMAMVSAEEKLSVYAKLNALFGDRFYVTYSAANLVEITAKGHDKGTAVRFLAEHYGIPISASIAIGDNWNDAPMLAAAGLGVAVENASEDLKRVADCVAPSNDCDGVGSIILQYGLGERL